jgi:2-C-methyl-D-erythritol 4-phosphate cytidylyltransferase
VEDDHVDRPGVEVQQCMKLTGTNSSIGLIVLIDQCSSALKRFDEQQSRPFVLTRHGAADGPAPQGATASGLLRCQKRTVGKRLQRRVQKKHEKANACTSFSKMLRFADLVVMAGRLHPFPFRTRP